MGSENQGLHNYYQVLGVERDAGDLEIDEAYEARLVACDELSHEPELDGLTHEDVKKIRTLLIQAYKTLRDPTRRADYDNSYFGESALTNISNSDLDLSASYNTDVEQPATDAVALVMDPEYTPLSTNYLPEEVEPATPIPADKSERARRFTEFPSFPNMMEAQQAASTVIPQGRLKKTTSLPAEAVEQLTDAVRKEMSATAHLDSLAINASAEQENEIDQINQEVESRLDNLADRFRSRSNSQSQEKPQKSSNPANVQSVQEPANIRRKHATTGHSSGRPSMEMRRSMATSTSVGEGKSLDYLLMFFAFILPLGTILFVVAYLLLG